MLLVLIALAEVTAAQALAEHRSRTAVAVQCRSQPRDDAVTVCARRAADRYRLPLVPTPDPGDPRHEGVPAERERLFARTTQCEEKTPFLVGCGMVGVHMTAGAGGVRIGGGERAIAP